MMFGNRCQFDYDEETIEPKAEKENSKRKSNAMSLKAFLAKWQWASLENADEVLTQSEQKVWGLMEENDRLKAAVEAECQEHQEAMRVADKTIRVLAKALELACKHIEAYSDSCYYCPKKQYCGEKCGLDSGENECIYWLMNYFKTTARKELENE